MFIEFTVPDYNLLQNEYVSSANGNMGIVKSVIRTINAIQAATNSSTFNVTGNTLGKYTVFFFSVYSVVMLKNTFFYKFLYSNVSKISTRYLRWIT